MSLTVVFAPLAFFIAPMSVGNLPALKFSIILLTFLSVIFSLIPLVAVFTPCSTNSTDSSLTSFEIFLTIVRPPTNDS